MTIEEKIQRYTQKLPPSFQAELLDFVEYLVIKAEQQENKEWEALTLSAAMRDLTEEPALYSLADLKVVFA